VAEGGKGRKPRRRIWVPQVLVQVRVLRSRLDVAEARGLAPDQEAAAEHVRALLDKAEDAALKVDPMPRRLANWWRGALMEAAFTNLHAAQAEIIEVYDDAEVLAEIPTAVARAQAALPRGDLRRPTVADLHALPPAVQRAQLRRCVADGYEASDQHYQRLRSFRNVILLATVAITLILMGTLATGTARPDFIPLCFPVAENPELLNCPTGTEVGSARVGDILIVALLGLLGGAFSAALSIRNLRGTSTPYDVPVALAVLKFPLGAFTAVVGLILLGGGFIPGLTNLDSQEQILAYALLFGFAQQLGAQLLDKQAQSLLNAVPSKDAAAPPPPPLDGAILPSLPAEPVPSSEPVAAGPPPEADELEDVEEVEEVEAEPEPKPSAEEGPVAEPAEAEPKLLDNPEGDDEEQGEQIQDDEADVLPDAPPKDSR
jgi:hypothetical protein